MLEDTAQPTTTAEATGQAVSMKRNAATKLFVIYEDPSNDNKRNYTGFDFKSELDVWLAETNVTIIAIIRGVEKKFKTVNRINLT